MSSSISSLPSSAPEMVALRLTISTT